MLRYVVYCCMMCVHTSCLHVACSDESRSVHHNVSSFHSCIFGVAGLCLWWEFGTIRPAVGAIAPIEGQPEPMTLKMKNAGEKMLMLMLPTVLPRFLSILNNSLQSCHDH